jgi:hypothetical protein
MPSEAKINACLARTLLIGVGHLHRNKVKRQTRGQGSRSAFFRIGSEKRTFECQACQNELVEAVKFR